jgi:hypothetical protein
MNTTFSPRAMAFWAKAVPISPAPVTTVVMQCSPLMPPI